MAEAQQLLASRQARSRRQATTGGSPLSKASGGRAAAQGHAFEGLSHPSSDDGSSTAGPAGDYGRAAAFPFAYHIDDSGSGFFTDHEEEDSEEEEGTFSEQMPSSTSSEGSRGGSSSQGAAGRGDDDTARAADQQRAKQRAGGGASQQQQGKEPEAGRHGGGRQRRHSTGALAGNRRKAAGTARGPANRATPAAGGAAPAGLPRPAQRAGRRASTSVLLAGGGEQEADAAGPYPIYSANRRLSICGTLDSLFEQQAAGL